MKEFLTRYWREKSDFRWPCLDRPDPSVVYREADPKLIVATGLVGNLLDHIETAWH